MDPMEYIVPNRKRLPYGMMNFAVIRREDYYYVDKTRFIPMIEQADRFFFFIRPRRFGKSLTLNVLQHYYDVRTRDKFNDLFGDLYIGKHPTANRNSYLVLYLNFSGITGELNDYRKGLDAHCQIRFDFFCEVYSDLLPQGIRERLDEKDGAVNQLDYLVSECERAGQKIETIGEFLEIIKPLFGREREKKELAKVFQALRIEVNQEMEALKEMLMAATEALKPGGRLVVITYHSLEDRMVKNIMKTGNVEGKATQDFFGNLQTPFRLVNNKVIVPDEDEITRNPRSRSAKLRIAEKK